MRFVACVPRASAHAVPLVSFVRWRRCDGAVAGVRVAGGGGSVCTSGLTGGGCG